MSLLVELDGVQLAVQDVGDGPPIVLLHGVTATSEHVVMGSRVLASSGLRVVSYDARGHGRSSAAPAATGYGYPALLQDLVAVLDSAGIDRAILVGASMGGHTALGCALAFPERVAALAVITPAFDPDTRAGSTDNQWHELASALRDTGIDGFLEAYGRLAVTAAWREPVLDEIRRRMALHGDLLAVADALDCSSDSRPFEYFSDLGKITVPVLVVATRDEPDPLHPLQLARRYVATLPSCELLEDDEGQVPLAWQGGRLSRRLADFALSAPGWDD